MEKKVKTSKPKAKKVQPKNIVHINEENLIGRIDDPQGRYSIIVTKQYAIYETATYKLIYNAPSTPYLQLYALIEDYLREDKTQEEKDYCDSLSILFANNMSWHQLYFQDKDLAWKVFEYHLTYVNNQVQEMMNKELQEDDPEALIEAKEQFNLQQQTLKENGK